MDFPYLIQEAPISKLVLILRNPVRGRLLTRGWAGVETGFQSKSSFPPRIGNGGSIVVGKGGTSTGDGASGQE
jgi:hypothetical protein